MSWGNREKDSVHFDFIKNWEFWACIGSCSETECSTVLLLSLQMLKEKLLSHHKLKKKESCVWFNLLIQFLFRECRDTQRLRRWASCWAMCQSDCVEMIYDDIILVILFLLCFFHCLHCFRCKFNISVYVSDCLVHYLIWFTFWSVIPSLPLLVTLLLYLQMGDEENEHRVWGTSSDHVRTSHWSHICKSVKWTLSIDCCIRM